MYKCILSASNTHDHDFVFVFKLKPFNLRLTESLKLLILSQGCTQDILNDAKCFSFPLYLKKAEAKLWKLFQNIKPFTPLLLRIQCQPVREASDDV